MSTHKPQTIEELVQQIQEALEQIPQIRTWKPDRDDVEHWTSDVVFKMEEVHQDVRDLQNEVAEVKYQVDDLQSEDR